MRVCNEIGCPTPCEGKQTRCDTHTRGTAAQRGYMSKGHKAFRAHVLSQDPVCVLCNAAFSTVADHYPRSKRELIAAGLDSNDPSYGRGLCHTCHSKETAIHQPGGWNAR